MQLAHTCVDAKRTHLQALQRTRAGYSRDPGGGIAPAQERVPGPRARPEETMKNGSFWSDAAVLPRFPMLKRNLTVDAVVIGGGITGATAAYLFKRRGHRVALLERGCCGGGDTSCTTAHLTCVTDLRLHQLVKNVGKEHARAVWEAGLASLDLIHNNVRTEDIRCDFAWVPGYLHAPPGQVARNRRSLMRDGKLAREIGFEAEYLEAMPYFGVPAVKVPHQARFHPMRYVARLLEAVPGQGCHVFEHSEATKFSEKPRSVSCGPYKIRCDYVVLATHTPLMANTGLWPATLLQSRLYPYSSYAMAAEVPKGTIPDALFWDTHEPYYYLRLEPGQHCDHVIFGGQDHKTGQLSDTETAFRRLARVLHQRIPETKPTHRWSGQVIETNDGLPFMGETEDRQFAVTGCSGNGMTLGTIGASMAVDAFEGRKNPWTRLFCPQRKRLRGGTWTYLKENRDYPYYLVRDRLARAEGKSLKSLGRNEGRILSLGGRKVAAYRDEHGKVTLRSPVCTHLKCIVAWNHAEKTWDCPCHGSRFAPHGEVLAGPAEEPLKKP
jgi:glycine/D-amino acid oxidase-like deaminating enzyme/nitrite reductase/ring-hydroxylating ferredoxin subunit